MAATIPALSAHSTEDRSWDRWNNQTARKNKSVGATSVFANPETPERVGSRDQKNKAAAQSRIFFRVRMKRKAPIAKPKSQLTDLEAIVMAEILSRFHSKMKK